MNARRRPPSPIEPSFRPTSLVVRIRRAFMHIRWLRSVGFAALPLVLLFPPAAGAQGDGFLFGPPRVSIGGRVGYDVPSAGSDLFDFSTEQFTLQRSDFRAPYLGGEVAVRVTERVDVLVDFGWERSRRRSEYRDWEDQDGLPIEQRTTFERTSMTFGAKYYFRRRGRRVGQLAWIPNRVAPFAGVGVGAMWHEFAQSGDFVDFDTLDVFADRLRTSGRATIARARAGADISLSSRLLLVGEARFDFGSGGAGGDYVGFADTDLSGVTFLLGISFRM